MCLGSEVSSSKNSLNCSFGKFLKIMFIEIFYERFLGNEVLFSTKNATVEFAFFNVTTDRMNITVKDGGDLFCCVESEIGGHLIPRLSSSFSNLRFNSYLSVWTLFQYSFLCLLQQNFCQSRVVLNSAPQRRHILLREFFVACFCSVI